jgi:hypothetical protein
MSTATRDEIFDLLGDRANEAIVDRIAGVGASLDEITEAIYDDDYLRQYGEERAVCSLKIDQIRVILEDLSFVAIRIVDIKHRANEKLEEQDRDELGRECQ